MSTEELSLLSLVRGKSPLLNVQTCVLKEEEIPKEKGSISDDS